MTTMGVVEQPVVQAGDVLFFVDGAQTHGTLPWNADHDRCFVLYKYAGRTTIRSGRSARLALLEIYWGEELVEGMSLRSGPSCMAPHRHPGHGM
jgi:hypothetical protein